MAVFAYLLFFFAIYFFLVKLRDLNVRPAAPPGEPAPVDLGALRGAVETSPTFENRSRLAWALLEQDRAAEAIDYFAQALSTHAQDRSARHGLGLAQIDAGQPDEGIATLLELIDQSFKYDDYRAALALADALFAQGQQQEALGLLRDVARSSRRLAHQVMLGRYEQLAGNDEAARVTLGGALAEFEALPDYQRRRYGDVATEARRLLRLIDDKPEA